MRSEKRGVAMAPLILILFLSLTLALMYGANVLTRKHQVLHLEYTQKARGLAYSGLAHAIGKFRENRKFGQSGEELVELMPYPEDPKAGYRLAFSSEESINNVSGDFPVYFDAAKTKVACPPGGLFLTAVGTYRGISVRSSAMLAAPPFSSAIASRGSIESTEGMILGSVPSGYDHTKPLNKKELMPAEMQSGGDVSVRGGGTIVGQVKANKSARVDEKTVDVSRATVEGGAKVDEIPELDTTVLSFAGKDGVQALRQDTFVENEKLSGLIEWSGEKLLFQQGLKLNGGILRVHGNVEIHGGVTGVGAILCDGNVTIVGASSLAADNQAAVVANGKISVLGPPDGQSYFQGLLYTKSPDGLAVVNSTVRGTVISAAPQAKVQVDRATIEFTAKSTHIDFDLGWTGYDPDTGIVSKVPAMSGPDLETRLKLSPIVGPDGNVILQPKPKDFLTAGIRSLSADAFTFEDGAGGKFFSASSDPKVQEALKAQGFVLDPGGKIQKAIDDLQGNEIPKTLFASLVNTVSNLDPAKPTSGISQFKLDLNQFLKTSDRLRIVWKN